MDDARVFVAEVLKDERGEQFQFRSVKLRKPDDRPVFEIEYAGPGNNEGALTIIANHVEDFAQVFSALASAVAIPVEQPRAKVASGVTKTQ